MQRHGVTLIRLARSLLLWGGVGAILSAIVAAGVSAINDPTRVPVVEYVEIQHPRVTIDPCFRVTEAAQAGWVRRDWSNFLFGAKAEFGCVFPAVCWWGLGHERICKGASWESIGQWGTFPDAQLSVGPAEVIYESGIEQAAGWPMLAFWCQMDRASASGPPGVMAGCGGLLLIPESPPGDCSECRVLPYRPLWSGLAFDSLFWGGASWIGFGTLRAGCRFARQGRGLCPACKYDLRGRPDSGCSECGWGRGAAGRTHQP